MSPPVSHAQSGDIHIPYQVLGDGPSDAGSGIAFRERGEHALKGLGE